MRIDLAVTLARPQPLFPAPNKRDGVDSDRSCAGLGELRACVGRV